MAIRCQDSCPCAAARAVAGVRVRKLPLGRLRAPLHSGTALPGGSVPLRLRAVPAQAHAAAVEMRLHEAARRSSVLWRQTLCAGTGSCRSDVCLTEPRDSADSHDVSASPARSTHYGRLIDARLLKRALRACCCLQMSRAASAYASARCCLCDPAPQLRLGSGSAFWSSEPSVVPDGMQSRGSLQTRRSLSPGRRRSEPTPGSGLIARC